MVTIYIAVVCGIVRWGQFHGEQILFVALLVAGVMAAATVLWFAIVDAVHPKRRGRLPEPEVPPPEFPTTSPGDRPSAQTTEAAGDDHPSKEGRRKHWWARGLKRVNYGHYGLWKPGGQSHPD